VRIELIEGRPEYLRFSAPTYLLGWLYERLVNRVPGLACRHLIADPELRLSCANAAYARVQTYSWERCAGETFALMQKIAECRS
jgi:glycosyltransferase involved in cell wall biosynthesis